MNRLAMHCVALVCFLMWALPSPAAETGGFRMPLFNGENLDGWVVTGCEARVEDGTIMLVAGDGYVRTELQYGDFVLELDWRALGEKDWDSGIYFRAEAPPERRAWPLRYQVNLLQGKEGNVNGLPGAESQGLVKPGEWNHFKLTAIGGHAELEINGQPAWQADEVANAQGWIGLQAEVAKGGQFQFRDIYVTELNHRSLFNGQDLTGWEGGDGDAAACWKAADGLLMCTGQPGPWLRAAGEFGDFDLRLEYKLKPGGNSGVYVRVPASGAHQGREQAGGKPSGTEVQILDDRSDRYREIQPYQFCGSVYAIAPAMHHVCREAGHWNTLEIECKGPNYRVVHNGVVIVDAQADMFPELNNRELRGFLGLQNHSEEVLFRHLRISEQAQ